MLQNEKLLVKFEFKLISTNRFETLENVEFEELGTYLCNLSRNLPPIHFLACLFAYDKEIV